MGAKIAGPPAGGMYLWADFGRDTNELAAAGSREGVLLAPGSLFSPTQLPSTWMRVAAATCLNDRGDEIPGARHARYVTLRPRSLWVEHGAASPLHPAAVIRASAEAP